MNRSLFSFLRDRRENVTISAVIGPAEYLGVPVLLIEEERDGWLMALWPDRMKPGRSHGKNKPFTYQRGEWWRLWGDQVKPSDHEYEAPAWPLILEPKPEESE